jgi:hypothetical protein
MKKTIYFLHMVIFIFAICSNTYPQDSLRTRLERVYETDQNVRADLMPLIEKYGAESPQADSLKNVLMYTDSVNEVFMKAFLNEHGFMGKKKIGRKGTEAEWVVLQHSTDLSFQQKWLPQVLERAQEGDFSKEQAAMLVDRVRVRTGQLQLYGTQMKWNSELGKWEPFEIEDPEHLAARRKLMGLEPMEEYVRIFENK